MYAPSRHAKFLTPAFVKDYQQRPLFMIGKDGFSRPQLARMGVVQARACGILARIARDLGATSVEDLFAKTSPYTLSEFPAGLTTLFVLFAIFDEHDLDVMDWYKAGRKEALVSFLALKARELKAKARETKDAKKRARKQRRESHEAAVKKIVNGTNHAAA